MFSPTKIHPRNERFPGGFNGLEKAPVLLGLGSGIFKGVFRVKRTPARIGYSSEPNRSFFLVTFMVPIISIEEYVTEDGTSPFGGWFDDLDAQSAAIVSVALTRLADGNTSKVEPIGEGAAELKINRGPGYRIYFGWDGKALVILFGGGTKRRQSDDIAEALAHWRAYKARKAQLKKS